MKEFVYETGDFSLYCQGGKEIVGLDLKKQITITMYRGGGSRLVIPDTMTVDGEEIPVTAIGKKAFLGCNSLRQISLPASMEMLEDWAFAQCEHLRKVIIRGGLSPAEIIEKIMLGRGVFDDCRRIEHICLGTEDKTALSALLGAVIYRMDAEYLLKDSDIGTENWFYKWDKCLASFLEEEDDEGYINMVLCGEEDVGNSVTDFVSDKRKRKSALCLLRLSHDELLSKEHREKFTQYLLNHSKGCESEEAWEVILSDFSDNADFYKLFAELGCVNEGNIDEMLIDMGEHYAEAKAFLIGYKQENFGGKDIFSSFVL